MWRCRAPPGRRHEHQPGAVRRSGGRQRDPAIVVGGRRQCGERQHAGLCRRERQSGRNRGYRSGWRERRRCRHQPQSQYAAAKPVVDRDVRSSYAGTSAQLYQQLQQIYGTPGSSSSFDAIFNNFTSALQTLSTSPSSYSAQSATVSAAQGVAQNLNSMTASIQQLRGQAEAGIASGVQTANTALQQIAQINQQLAGGAAGQLHRFARGPARPGHDAARTADERQCRAGFRQPNFGLHRHRPATCRRIAGRRNFRSTMSGRCPRLRNGAPIRARIASARSRSPSPGGTIDRSDRHERHPIGTDRRLYADARQHFAAGASAARRAGESDVAGFVEPDDARQPP